MPTKLILSKNHTMHQTGSAGASPSRGQDEATRMFVVPCLGVLTEIKAATKPQVPVKTGTTNGAGGLLPTCCPNGTDYDPASVFAISNAISWACCTVTI